MRLEITLNSNSSTDDRYSVLCYLEEIWSSHKHWAGSQTDLMTILLWRGKWELQMMWMQQPRSTKGSPPPPAKRYIRCYTQHLIFTEENGSFWVTEGDTLIKTSFSASWTSWTLLLSFLIFAFSIETSQSYSEEKSKCIQVIAFNWYSLGRTVPLTPTTVPLVTSTKRGHGLQTHWE